MGCIRLYQSRGRKGRQTLAGRVDEVPFVEKLTFPLHRQEQLQDLWSHFQALNLEAHMYASQWFLTLFTAKFPLCMVFHITDLLLCEVQSGLTVLHNAPHNNVCSFLIN